MKKHGIAKIGQLIGNISAGKISDYKYDRKKLAQWDLASDSKWIFYNVNIIDVDNGRIHKENALLIDGTRFGKRLDKQDLEVLSAKPEIKKIIDGKNNFLIPGMSDMHCHLSLISEYKLNTILMHSE